MELEAINNKIKYVYIFIIQIINFIYIGSGENSNNKNRLDTHLYELTKKKDGEPSTMKLFKAINEFILNTILYEITHIPFHDFLNAINKTQTYLLLQLNIMYNIQH